MLDTIQCKCRALNWYSNQLGVLDLEPSDMDDLGQLPATLLEQLLEARDGPPRRPETTPARRRAPRCTLDKAVTSDVQPVLLLWRCSDVK